MTRLALAVALALVLVTGCGADDRVERTAGPWPHPSNAPGRGLASPIDRAEMAFTDGWRPPPSPPTLPARRSPAPRPRASRSQPHTPPGGVLACIRAGESGGNYRAVSPSGKYRGAYQFDASTWRAMGGTGDPATASPGEQDARAAELYRQRGTQPWPNRGRCG